MSYWDYKTGKVVGFKPEAYPGYPGWLRCDCGCSNGIQWGGESPIECNHCNGSGSYAKHIKTGLRKDWPGGKFC